MRPDWDSYFMKIASYFESNNFSGVWQLRSRDLLKLQQVYVVANVAGQIRRKTTYQNYYRTYWLLRSGLVSSSSHSISTTVCRWGRGNKYRSQKFLL